MTNRPSVALADCKRQQQGDPALKVVLIYVFDSWLVQVPGHTKDFTNGIGPYLHGTQDKVGTTKHNWSPSVSIM